MAKQFALTLTVSVNGDGLQEYFVESVTNSTKFIPGQTLRLEEVEEIMRRDDWHVVVIGRNKE